MDGIRNPPSWKKHLLADDIMISYIDYLLQLPYSYQNGRHEKHGRKGQNEHD